MKGCALGSVQLSTCTSLLVEPRIFKVDVILERFESPIIRIGFSVGGSFQLFLGLLR